jgi:tetratricopeptide (TPR) repeat protein
VTARSRTKAPAFVAFAIIVLVATLSPARADEPEPAPPAAEARAHYDKGLTHYHLGQFDDAAREFKIAYELSERPGLLFNIAQAYRLGGHPAEAAYFYRTYLRLVPDAANRADVEDLVAEADAAVKAEEVRHRRERERQVRAEEVAQHKRRLRLAGVITAGSGVLLAGAGSFFAVRAAGAEDDLETLAAEGGTWSDAYAAIQDDGERDDAIGTTLILTGSAAVAAGVGLYVWSLWQDEPPPARLSASMAHGGGGWLWLGWDF